MATVIPIRIQISSEEAESGRNRVVRSLRDIRREAENTSRGVSDMSENTSRSINNVSDSFLNFRNILRTIIGISIVSYIRDLADSFINLKNKILTVSDSIQDANNVLNDLFEIANRSRVPVENLSGLFQKLTSASKELSTGRDEILRFLETVGKATAIQGASTAATDGALIQLTQSLGGVKVQAEEFNSILDGAYPIAQAAARGIDRAAGSVNKLQQLVKSGQITSKEFFDAILSQSDYIDEQFAKTNASIASSFTVLKNKLIEFVGESEGIIGVLAKTLLLLAGNIDIVLKAGIALGAGLLVAFSPQILGAAIGFITLQVRALTVAIASNPIGFLLTLITSSIVLLYEFSDQIKISSDRLATLADVFAIIFGDIISGLGYLLEKIYDFAALGLKYFTGFGDATKSGFKNIGNFFITVMDTIIGVTVGTVKAIIAGFKVLPSAIADIFLRALNASIDIMESGTNYIIDILNFLPGVEIDRVQVNRIKNQYEGAFGEIGTSAQKAFLEGYNADYISNYVDSVLSRAEDRAKTKLESQVTPDTILPNTSGEVGKLSDKVKSKAKGASRAVKGVKDNIDNTVDSLNEFGKTFESIIDKIGDSLTDFVRTGKLDFKDLINSILNDLTRLSITQFVTDPLKKAVSSFAGNLFTDQGSTISPILNSVNNDFYRPSDDFVGPIKPSTSGFFSGVGNYASNLLGFDQGINYVPKDMFALLHRGEKVLTADQNKNNHNNGPVTVNLVMPNVQDYNSFRENRNNASSMVAKALQNSIRRNS